MVSVGGKVWSDSTIARAFWAGPLQAMAKTVKDDSNATGIRIALMVKFIFYGNGVTKADSVNPAILCSVYQRKINKSNNKKA